MNKLFPSSFAALLLAGAVVSAAPAPAPRGQMQIGPVHMTFSGGRYVGSSALHLSDVVMTSKDYDLQAATVVADTPPGAGGGRASFSKIVANGDPAKKTQVTGRFVSVDPARKSQVTGRSASVEQVRTYLIRGDKAVYVPEPGRLDGGRIDFTGHVVVTLQAPQALDGPAVSQLERATVLVGPNPDYPQVEFGAGTLDFTPLPQGH